MLWCGIILLGSLSYMVLNNDNKEVKEIKEEKSNYDKTFYTLVN